MRKTPTVTPGQRFGRLVVIREDDRKYGHRYILCKCDCGTEKSINLHSLLNGCSNSCGCLRREYIASKNFKHGFANRNNELERIYCIWSGMKKRCYSETDPGYKNYGGRGITICDEWKDNYPAFREWSISNGYSDELSIDRIDNDKGYAPDNCRWTTAKVQGNNTRVNHRVTYKGETHTLSEWSDITGIDDNRIGQRLKKGLPLEKVFFNGNLKYYDKKETSKC